MGRNLAFRCLLPLLLVAGSIDAPPPFEIPTCRYTVDSTTGNLIPHVHKDADTDPRWWLQPRCPAGARCSQHFAQPTARAEAAGEPGQAEGLAGQEEALLRSPCDIRRYLPSEVSDPVKIIAVMGKGEPFIISDATAPDMSRSTASAQAKANVDWQPQGPTVLTTEALKEALGPRRLVAPQCTLVNGTSFSNYKGDSPERRGESFISSTCEVAWEHVVDGILLEKPLPVAAKYLEGHGSEGQGFGELDEGSEDEAIVRRPVKLQKRLQVSDIIPLTKPIFQGIPAHIWGGWDFVDKTASLLFLASRETRTPLHKDTFNILNIQLNGTKHWTVFPDEAKKHIQELMGPKSDARQRRGPLDLQEPLRSKLKARSCLLRPFEVLYIPGGFWHDVYSLTPGISLSVRLAQMFEKILQQQRALGQR